MCPMSPQYVLGFDGFVPSSNACRNKSSTLISLPWKFKVAGLDGLRSHAPHAEAMRANDSIASTESGKPRRSSGYNTRAGDPDRSAIFAYPYVMRARMVSQWARVQPVNGERSKSKAGKSFSICVY